MPVAMRFMLPAPGVFVSVLASIRDRTERRRASTRPTSAAKSMMPKPPSWISARITTLPKGLQKTAVSTTTSPVTQTAEVAVNRASIGGVQVPSLDEIGSMSSSVPAMITAPNPAAMTWAGARLRRRPAARRSRVTDGHYRPAAPTPHIARRNVACDS